MARETKVGLLVGLAFIICFAIILANHGQRGLLVETMPGFAITGTKGSGQTPPREAGRPANQSDRSVTTAPTVMPGATIASTPPRVDRDLTVKTSPLKLHFQDPNIAAGQPAEMGAMAQQIEELKSQITDLLAQNQASNTPHVATPSTAGGVTLTATPVTGQQTNLVPPASSTDRDQAVSNRRHVVGPGDTLSRIADRYYGSKSGRAVRLIFEANRAAIKDIDRVPLGVELVIPMDPTAGSPTTAAKTAPRAQPSTAGEEQVRATGKPAATSPQKESPREKLAPPGKNEPFRWYQVRKNDRYASIARQQLGDEKRWKEIFEMNKEKFPKEGMIREGVRIKLPSDDVADSRGKRR